MKIATLVALVLVAGCETLPVSGDDVELRTIASGAYAAESPDEPQAHVARDAERYRSAWDSLIGEGEPPAVDFANETVIILLGGMKPTGGWSVEPQGVVIEDGVAVVTASVRSPPGGSIVTQALTSPWAAVVVRDRSFQSVRWQR